MTNFALTFHHKYSLNEIEGMLPWERDAYLKIITDYIEQEHEKLKSDQAKNSR